MWVTHRRGYEGRFKVTVSCNSADGFSASFLSESQFTNYSTSGWRHFFSVFFVASSEESPSQHTHGKILLSSSAVGKVPGETGLSFSFIMESSQL